VRLYLGSGFSVANWKHALSLVRWRGDPPLRARITDGRMDLLQGGDQTPLLSASRAAGQLRWRDHRPPEQQRDPAAWFRLEPTLALWLAVQGWPLIRNERAWADRRCWMDSGMPEGLAHKIQLWEAYAHHHGLPVRTPRIPGLAYPTWSVLNDLPR